MAIETFQTMLRKQATFANQGEPTMKQLPSIQPQARETSRREFIANGSKIVAASALAGVTLPHVHAAEDNTIRLALIGCGG
ncbi:MAG: hypothetical protein FJ388_13620, partial [Verrucomicrobia bacterium]|nr:hypothetical protein [Verrucomicrobiota bacterium]